MNHFRTAIDLSLSVLASAMAANRAGRSHQYAIVARQDHNPCAHQATSAVPGNSVSEMGERMKGGAVKDERSPEKDAILRTGQAKYRRIHHIEQIVSGLGGQ